MSARPGPEPDLAGGSRGWRRTFWVVFVSNLLSAAGLMSFLPFFPSLLEELGIADEHARALWSGVLFGAAPLSAGFSGPLWGSVGDRYGRKLMVVRSLVGLGLFVGLMGWARSPWQLLFLRLGQGVFSGYMPPSLTLVSVAAPARRQGEVTSWIQTASTVGTIAGPMLGALLLVAGGVRAVFQVTALGAGVSALLVGLLAVEEASDRAPAGRFSASAVLRSSAQDLAALLTSARMRAAIALYAAVHFTLGAVNPLLELFVEDLWHGDPARVDGLTGTLFSTLAVAAIVGTPLWGRLGDRYGHATALRLASALSAVTMGLHALVPSYAWLFGVRLVFGLVSPGASASAFGLAATETGRQQRGAAMGAVFSARCFAISAGSFLGGSLVPVLGLRGLFLVAGGVIALALFAGRERAPAADGQV